MSGRSTSNNEIEEQPVTIGLQTADKIEILSGLKEGDSGGIMAAEKWSI